MSSRPIPLQGRLLNVVIVVALVAGGGLATAGLADLGGGDDASVVLDVAPEVATQPPVTAAPLVDPPIDADDADDTDDTDIATSADPDPANVATEGEPDAAETSGPPERDDTDAPAAELSPLAALVGPRFSTIPEEIEPRPRPTRLQIDSIDVARFPIRDVGLEPDGQLEVPDETEIGWYRYGATAGRPGATVLAAHVSWNRTTGPFAQLGRVEPGDRIEVTLDDGTQRRYEVTERTMYGKLELPRERIWRNTGPETLVLITCGGDFNPEIRRYLQNIVVYAVPVG